MEPEKPIDERVAQLYRTESRRVLATLIRLLGDFDLAEDALQEAFRAALEQWPREGLPRNPRAWLVSTGRFKGIDVARRRGRHEALLAKVAQETPQVHLDPEGLDDETLQDDQLRLIFTCCHPALPQDGRIALALREVCGLTTEEIARAFLVTPATMTRRIARAKERIRKERLPYEVPSRQELARRLAAVLQVVYLVYNEGFVTTAGEALSRRDLAEDALYLGRLIVDLLPEPEAIGLLGLMLLHESRRPARVDARGDVIPLEAQDRSLWNQELIAEGMGLDARIGRSFLKAGLGFGGFCFPKDLQAFVRIAEKNEYDFALLKEVEKINKGRIDVALEKLKKALWVLTGKTIGIFGLAFKPQTDDIRFAPAIELIQRLRQEGCKLRAYDPKAMEKARRMNPDVFYAKDPYEVAEGAEALILATEWPDFLNLDWLKIRNLMIRPFLLDGRNFLNKSALMKIGFEYESMGRSK